MTHSHPPTSVGLQAWGSRPYLQNLLGFQPHRQLRNQTLPFCRVSVSSCPCELSVSALRSTREDKRVPLLRTGCVARGWGGWGRVGGRGTHNSHWVDWSSGSAGASPRSRRQANGTHEPVGSTPFSSGESCHPLGGPSEASPLGKEQTQYAMPPPSLGSQAALREAPTPGWIDADTSRTSGTRSTKGTLAFSFPVLFFFSLNLRKQVLRRQHSSVGPLQPEGHTSVPVEGVAGGGLSHGGARGRAGLVQPQRFTQPAGKIHFFHLGPFDEGVVHEHLQIRSLCWVLN